MNSSFCGFCSYYNRSRVFCELAKDFIAVLDYCPNSRQGLLDQYVRVRR